MAKTVIFNNQVYELDENKLAPINASIVEFLTTELAGTGATIKFNNTTYEVDGTKLSTSKSELVNFLGTIEGEGEVIQIDEVEYSVASSALEEANVTVAETLVNLSAASEGLEYELYMGGAHYLVIGIGTCTDTDVVIPAEYEGLPVKTIGYQAFSGCGNITSVTIPDSVTRIVDNAFYSCTGLTSVTIPNSVTSIEGSVFAYCSSLTSFTVPDSVTSIGGSAFYNCTSLTSVDIPDSVTSIGAFAFKDCDSLTSITVDESNTAYKSINGNLYSKDGKTLIQYAIGKTDTSFTIPDSVKSIGNYAFEGCTGLTSVTIPNGVTSIGERAFYYCRSLMSVTIGNGVTSIGDYAFSFCSSLTDIYINKEGNSISGSPWGAPYATVHWNSTGPDNLITFTIDGTSYQAEKGMTWAEWCESDYNTSGCYVSSSDRVTHPSYIGLTQSTNSDNIPEMGSYSIIANGEYRSYTGTND